MLLRIILWKRIVAEVNCIFKFWTYPIGNITLTFFEPQKQKMKSQIQPYHLIFL
jgi:hypothetical protein